MKGTKIKHVLASALLILPLALQVFGGASAVSADDTTTAGTDTTGSATTTKVELTKLVFKNGTDVTFNNDGKQLSGDDLQGGTPVQGVEFQAYNITDSYAKAIADAQPAEGVTKEQQAIKDIQDGAAKAGNGDAYGKAVSDTAATTDKSGVVDFDLPNLDGAGNYQTYLIVETKYSDPEANAANTIIQRSTPLVLTMPLNTAKTGDTVYLYPKNFDQQTVTKNLPDLQLKCNRQ